MRPSRRQWLLVIGVALALSLSACVHVERSSVSTGGVEGNGWSVSPSLSDDGRFVAFTSAADNLVAGDDNRMADVFVRDHQERTTTLVSAAADGGVAVGGSGSPSISDDGRHVAFTSIADDLVPGDVNADTDVYVRDLTTGTTTRVSRNSDGTVPLRSGAGAISGDGRHVVYLETGELPGTGLELPSVVTFDLATGVRRVVSASTIEPPLFGYPVGPLSITDDGSKIAFGRRSEHSLGLSFSSVNLWERATSTSTPIASGQTANAVQDASLSGDGSIVTFSSMLDHVPEDDVCVEPPLGSTVLPPECDTDVFAWRADGSYESLTPGPNRPGVDQAAISLADDGTEVLLARHVGSTTSLVVQDRIAGQSAVVARGPDGSAVLSGDGRLVAFGTGVALDPGDTNETSDVYVRRSIPPQATSAEPAGLARGTTTAVTVEGHGFEPGTTLATRHRGVSFSSVQVVDATTLTAQVSVDAGATAGPIELLVSTPGRLPGSSVGAALTRCTDCLVVSR